MTVADGEHRLHLWLNNQVDDEEPIDVTVFIDNVTAACYVFDSHTQLERVRFDFDLSAGTHELRVSSQHAELVEPIKIGSDLWGVVDVNPDSSEESPGFGLAIQENPTVFDQPPEE